VDEPNSIENPEFRKDLEFINEQLSKTKLGELPSESPARSDATKVADAIAPPVSEEASLLDGELAQICVDTGATGAAIAFLRGDEMVCHAASGPQAPVIGVRLDPRSGLSGACIQTRQLQQCKDTQTDVRVDAEVCRRLGLRSVVVLPLVDGNELFGILEILSPLPNAFSQFDLDILHTVADRMVERRRQNRKSNASVTPKESGLFRHKLEQVVLNTDQPFILPRLDQISRKIDRRTTVLGVLVIASAMLLGMLVGWRQGWQKATLSLRTSPPFSRANVLSRHGQADHIASPVIEAQPASAGTDECGSLAPASPAIQPPSGGLTICEQGRVIFRSPQATVVPVRNLPTPSRPGDASANTARR
jgi:putative methionine-R-sulfoxide reductase with GAF domain